MRRPGPEAVKSPHDSDDQAVERDWKNVLYLFYTIKRKILKSPAVISRGTMATLLILGFI
jgi:hypothetical protein